MKGRSKRGQVQPPVFQRQAGLIIRTPQQCAVERGVKRYQCRLVRIVRKAQQRTAAFNP